MTPPTITKQLILHWIDQNQRIFERGYRYLQRQMLFEVHAGESADELTAAHKTLHASCHGIENKRYELWVRFEDGNLVDTDCTCPYELECKHIVALLLHIAFHPEALDEAP